MRHNLPEAPGPACHAWQHWGQHSSWVLSLCTSDKDHCAGNGSLSGSIEHSEERSLCPRETLLGPVFGYLGYLATDAVQAAAHVVSPKPRFPAGRDPRFHYSRSPLSLIVSWRQIFGAKC